MSHPKANPPGVNFKIENLKELAGPLNGAIDEANAQAEKSHEATPQSYLAGYDQGFLRALVNIRTLLTSGSMEDWI